MTTGIANKTDLIEQIDEVVSEMTEVMTSLDESEINLVPYKDSWTAGQLIRHIVKSTEGMYKVMTQDGDKPDRDPLARVDELKNIFLNFSSKLQSPDFIIPEEGPYKKLDIIQQLGHNFQELRKSAKDKDLTVIVKGLPFGDITKSELLHFVLYHTQRHLNQLRKIHEALRNRPQ